MPPTFQTPVAPTTTAPSTDQLLNTVGTQVASGTKALENSLLPYYFAHLGLLQFFSIIISAAFIGLTVWIIVKTGWLTLRVERIRHVVLQSDLSKKHVQESWKNVEQHFFEGDENDLKIAIIEADKLLNEALRSAGVFGTQLGDRLKKATPEQVPNLDEVWQAHRLRNQIAHEPDFKLKRDLAERALNIYHMALENLGVFEENPKTTPKQQPAATSEEEHH
jgi:hypothetical protein